MALNYQYEPTDVISE